MTSIDFLNKVHKSLDSQEYSLSYSPAKSKNYMLYCNGNFIGGLFDEELCFVYTDSVSELLGQPDIDGGLIGGASLNAADFIAIINAANQG